MKNKSRVSDKEYLKKCNVRALPPSFADISSAIDNLVFDTIDDENSAQDFKQWTSEANISTASLKAALEGDFVFLSGQNLVPIFGSMGYDIRHVIDADIIDLPYIIYETLANRAGIPKPALGGVATIQGRHGVILPVAWLRDAGIEPTISKGWSQSVERNGAGAKSKMI